MIGPNVAIFSTDLVTVQSAQKNEGPIIVKTKTLPITRSGLNSMSLSSAWPEFSTGSLISVSVFSIFEGPQYLLNL